MEPKTIADFVEENQLDIEKIIEKYEPYVYTILKNGMRNQEDREEILSDVFMILWKNYEYLDRTIEIKPYLIGITRNLLKKKYHQKGWEKTFEAMEKYEDKVSSFIDVQDLAEENEKSKVVADTIKRMNFQEQQIFMMFYYQSRKIKEISKELEISETKVKVTLHRLRKKIKKKLKERGYGYGKS